ncbi:peptidase M48 Ste24p [Klebsiella pneumoniae]|uniref:Peptidase M48 Ste24p n=3 Tax=Enterobacterales TaxID=91347 RepID=A0A377U4C6_KLEPN|nr:peptidase M48 Ste24p [Klebsiella pneumoniae]
MKIRSTVLALGIAATLTGCQNMDSNGLLSSGAEAFQAYSLSDAQVKTLSDQACKEMDAKAKIAPANSEYSQRLNKIAAALGDNINGQPVNYKVYETKDVNAFAMANGCIRVYSGLMDLMNDNEVEAVIGHEMGHVALGHVKKGMQVALGTNAVRAAAASAGGIVSSLSQSQLGDLGEKLVNSQFSQRQESEADDYSYDLLRKRGINPSGLATSFEKLAKLEAGRQSSMFDDHPASEARAQHIRDRMKADALNKRQREALAPPHQSLPANNQIARALLKTATWNSFYVTLIPVILQAACALAITRPIPGPRPYGASASAVQNG